MKFARIAAVAVFGITALATGAKATPFNFAVAIAFDNVGALTAAGANAATNLASAAEFTFAPLVSNGPNGNTTGSPITSDPVLAAQLAYPTFLSSTNLGLSGTGGTTAFGGTNSFYFFNFVSIAAATGAVSGNKVGGFETATGSVVVSSSTESASFVDVKLTGLFTPSAADATLGYTNTPATLDVDFTSTCAQNGLCSVSGSGTLTVGQVATAVPEPGTLALLATSILGLGLITRRKIY